MANSIGSCPDLSIFSQKHPNLLRVLQEIQPSSPVCRVKDREQPSQGYLTRQSFDFLTSAPDKKREILQCKALHNEKLAPTMQQEVVLTMGNSLLLRKRQRNTC